MINGYEATMLLSDERPDLIPLVRLILEMGDEAFNDGLAELVARGLLTKDTTFAKPLLSEPYGDDRVKARARLQDRR